MIKTMPSSRKSTSWNKCSIKTKCNQENMAFTSMF